MYVCKYAVQGRHRVHSAEVNQCNLLFQTHNANQLEDCVTQDIDPEFNSALEKSFIHIIKSAVLDMTFEVSITMVHQ